MGFLFEKNLDYLLKSSIVLISMKNIPLNSWKLSLAQYIACAIALLAPLWIGFHQWYPHTTPKVSLITFWTIVMSVLYFWDWLGTKKNNRPLFQLGWVHVALAVFLFVLSVSGLLGENPSASFFGSFSRGISISFFATLSLFSLVVAELIKMKPNIITKLSYCFFVSSVINALFTYVGPTGIRHIKIFYMEDGGASLFLGNSSFLGALLAFGLFFGAYLFFSETNKVRKWLVALGVLLIALCPTIFNITLAFCGKLFSTLTQHPTDLIGDANGAVIGLVFGVATFLATYYSQIEKKSISRIGTIAAVILVACSVFLGARFLNPQSRIHKIYAEVKTSNRFYFWEIARDAGNKKPLLGHGFNTYEDIYQKSMDKRIFTKGYAPEVWIDRPHNALFEYFAASGYAGLASYLVLVAVLLVSLYRLDIIIPKLRLLRATLVGMVIAYFVQNLFVFDSPVVLLLFFFVIALGMTRSSNNNFLQKVQVAISKRFIALCLLIISLVLVIPLVILPTIETRLRYTMIRDLTLSEYPKQRERVNGISWFGNSGEDATSIVRALSLTAKNIDKMTPDNQDIFVAVAQSTYDSLEKSLKKEPESLKLHYVAGVTSRILAQTLATDPKKLNEKQVVALDQALEHFKKAISLNPNYTEPYIESAQILVLLGKTVDAAEMMKKANKVNPNLVKQYTTVNGKKVEVSDGDIPLQEEGWRRTTSC